MMKLMKLYFNTAAMANLVLFVFVFIRDGGDLSHLPVLTSAFALANVLINLFLIVPRALQAGARAIHEADKEKDEHAVVKFAVEGGSTTQTKSLHQTVVLFVVSFYSNNYFSFFFLYQNEYFYT